MHRNSFFARRLVGTLLAASVVAATALTAVALPATEAGAAGAPAKVVFTTSPSAVAAGAVMATAPVVQLRDSSNVNVAQAGVTVTLTVDTGPGPFDPSATTSVDTNASGQAVFSNLVFDTAGAYTLTAASSGLTSVNSSSFTVSAGPLAQMALTNVPSNVVSGAALGITATLQDAYGNTETTTSSGSITLSVATGPAGGALAGTVTRTPSGGVTTFSAASLTLVGSYTITATDATVSTTSGPIVVTPGVAKKLAFVQAPTATTAGAVMSPAPTVQVEDTNGNPVADSGATVTVSSSGALTSGSTKSVTTDPTGLATFSNLTWNTAGSYTLTAASSGLTSSAANGPFTISPGAPTQLVFSTQPTTTAAGSVVSSTVVKIEDSLGNVLTSASDNVTLTPNGVGGFDPASTTTVAAVNGVATFTNLILDQSGGYTLTASSPDGAVGTSKSFTVTALAATHLAFTVQPVDGTAGVTQSPNVAVAAEDQYGNVNTTASGTVTLTTSPTGTVAAGARPLSNGVATFGTFNVQSVGTFTLSATLSGLTSTTSNSFTIAPGAPYALAYGTAPSNVTAGQIMTPAPTVLIEDHYGNLETGDNTDTVTLSTSVGFDPASTTTVTVVDGIATFSNVAIDSVGNVGHTIKASSTTVTVLPVTSATFDLSPAAPYSLAIVQPQLGGQVGTGNSIGTFYLEQYDQYGNNTWGPGPDGTPLTFSSSSPGGTFSLTDGGPSTTTGNFVYPPNDNNPPNNRDTYFYYGDTQVGLPTITVSSPGLISATQQVEIIDVENPGDQTSPSNAPIAPLQMTGQNSSPDYPFTSWSATGLPDGLSIDPSSGVISGTPTTAGSYAVEVYGYEGTYAYGYTGFTWTVANTVTVTGPGDQASTGGTAIDPVTVSATDSDPSATLSYSDGGTLPPGLSIDPTSGTISGTPTAAGAYPVTITATDGTGASGTATFTWTVGDVVTVTGPGDQSSTTGQAVTPVTVTASDTDPSATLTYGDGGTLPAGLSIDPSTGVISGTPTYAGIYPVTVTATDTTGASGSATFTWTVVGPTITHLSKTTGGTGGGTKVTIKGTGLTDATEVRFGSAEGTILHINRKGTKAKVVAPASSAGAVDVTLVTPQGSTLPSAADQFTYEGAVVTGINPSSGPAGGGTKVKISGSHLEDATQVLFGSTPGTIVSVNGAGTSVVAQSPAGSGTVDVTVVTPTGPTATSPADEFTYLTPAVTGLRPATGPAGGGTKVKVSGTNLGGATQVLFGSTPGTIVSVNGAGTSITVTAPAGSGIVDVTVVTGAGTSPVVPADQYTYG